MHAAKQVPIRIAVITAPNAGYLNPGMLTVDLAAAGVLKRAVPNSVLSWYTLHPPDQFINIHPYVNPSELPFDWRSLVEHFDEVCDHDVILLWGDFLQARHYFVEDALDRLVQSSNNNSNKNVSAAQSLELLYRCLLFSEATPEVLNRVFIFGSTILFNRQTDYTQDRYGEYLFRLVRNCGGVWTREPLSAAKIQHIRQDYGSIALGTDSAFLLRDEDIEPLSTTTWGNGPAFSDRIGVFLGGRTRATRSLITLLRQLTRQLGLQVEWLPWFPVHEWLRTFPRSVWNPVRTAFILDRQRKIDRLLSRGTNYSAGDLLAAIKQYRFIVTDTYHLCVNSWRVGTPAICFASPDGSPKQRTLDDYKKQVLYEMYDATDFYLNSTSIQSSAGRDIALETLLRLISDHSLARAVSERMCAHARHVEQTLADRLSALIVR